APRAPCPAALPLPAPGLRRAAPAAPAPRSDGSAPRTRLPAPRWVPCPSLPRAGGSSLHLDARGVGPEAFQVVVRAVVGVEDVHHHVAEVEQHPATSALAFAADHPMPLRSQLLLHSIR